MKRGRLVVLSVLAGAWLCAVTLRLYDLQVRKHEAYRERATRQQQRVVMLYPPRGTIFDARGRELAVSVEVSSVAADPTTIEDPEAALQALAGLVEPERLNKILASDREFAWIERKLDEPRARRFREVAPKGIFFLQESKRYYPLRSLAAQVLGYVGVDNKGLAGLEFLYDRVVTSEPGQRTVVRDARLGTVLHPRLEKDDATPGQNLHLTLDAAIQHLVERELARGIAESGARKGMIVVLDPNTGAILAMASYPTFDPNDFNASPRSHQRNQVVQDAYEPGSTFKMVTLAAALETGVVDPLETIDCEMGGIRLSGVRISDHHPFGELTTRQIIAKSSNVGAIKLGFAAGREQLFDTIRKFGFGQPTGIDLPSESSGILRPLERWSQLSPAYISFGQAVSVTALQLTNSFAAIANGGRLLEPYIVESIGDEVRRPQPRKVVGLPISPSSVGQVRSMLESVVLEGTAKAAAIPGYRVAGKTGTAQKAIAGKGYADGKYIASFVGFAPVKNPALVAAVILDEPWPRYHGGEVAAPIFKEIASQILLYLGVPPDRETEDVWPTPPEPRNPRRDLSGPGVDVRLANHSERPESVPAGTVPNFGGMSARQAIALSADLGLHVGLNGHGIVRRQSPAPGTPLEVVEDTVEVWLDSSGAL
ncbi:MAG: penicillin-binding protein [Acidobacteriota bacterium]